MSKFRKRPIVVEAEQFWPTMAIWPEGIYKHDSEFYLDTQEGWYEVTQGDWIITDMMGKRYPCKPDIFEMTHEPTEDPKPLSLKQADEIYDEMMRLENDPKVSKHELRLFMQFPMPCGHYPSALLTCDSPPFGCVDCGAIPAPDEE